MREPGGGGAGDQDATEHIPQRRNPQQALPSCTFLFEDASEQGTGDEPIEQTPQWPTPLRVDAAFLQQDNREKC